MSRTLPVPGARLHHEIRGQGPLVVLVGAPMDARPFAPLADLLAGDHTVLTTDPRGVNRSPVDDPEQDSTPEIRADDLARLIEHADAGPAVVFGSSGGAVSALALAQARPDLVTTVIAHEPPLSDLLPDADRIRAQGGEVIATHFAGDPVGAMRKFLEMADIHLPEPVFQEFFAQEPSPRDLADANYQYARMYRPTTRWIPDFEVLRTRPVVIGIGEESAGQLCECTSEALAAELGVEPARFPGDHTGFAADPAAFATRLRDFL
ncbi:MULTISPECIES: alpha/beta fold hydrolase [Amycolatopsis]|uniref:alpha/beta fold hydrolase n=1 Tax=Amycolatopsis TaxID=1813 RepID=UPI000B8AE7FE|nr:MULTISPECIES: alpha/beta hydrolase [Amycolatopsis]OXM73580.1 alpha/beta hydrolase [Amycolatopsis sp. KNN50.9b]